MARHVRVEWHGGIVTALLRRATVDGLHAAAEHLVGASRKLVPIQEGTLERSATASVDRERMRAAVSYDTPYAVRQHEDLNLKHDNGRTAKYLERPMATENAVMRELIRARVRRELP